jgi:hypothetical protein
VREAIVSVTCGVAVWGALLACIRWSDWSAPLLTWVLFVPGLGWIVAFVAGVVVSARGIYAARAARRGRVGSRIAGTVGLALCVGMLCSPLLALAYRALRR